MEQDPRFAFRIIADIANKALSPATTIRRPRCWRWISFIAC
jgi:uncharacterized membrane protein